MNQHPFIPQPGSGFTGPAPTTWDPSWPAPAGQFQAMADHPDHSIRSARFRKGREASWKRLEDLVAKLEKKGLGSLTGKEAIELPMLYQAELSSLAVARTTILDRNLTDYLEALSLRAYLVVYGPRASLLDLAVKFFKEGLPRSVRALKYHILVAFLLLFLSTLTGYLAVTTNPANYPGLVPDSLAYDRNYESSPEELAEHIFSGWVGLEEALVHFANFLFRHNTIVAILCFSLGFFLGIPTVILLIGNGLTLGAMIGLYFDKGLGLPFLGWLSIHGVTELSAIILAAAAGFSLAEKTLLPGRGSRLENLARQGADAATVMIGVVIMLLVAGILEGCFRQLISSTILRFVIAASTGAFWLWYFLRGSRFSKRG